MILWMEWLLSAWSPPSPWQSTWSESMINISPFGATLGKKLGDFKVAEYYPLCDARGSGGVNQSCGSGV